MSPLPPPLITDREMMDATQLAVHLLLIRNRLIHFVSIISLNRIMCKLLTWQYCVLDGQASDFKSKFVPFPSILDTIIIIHVGNDR